jgi:hypothetical protein
MLPYHVAVKCTAPCSRMKPITSLAIATLFVLASFVAAAQDPGSDARWVQLPKLTGDIIECAKYSDILIRPDERASVRLDRRTAAGTDPDTDGPEIPFDAGPAFRTRARWVSLQLDEGWLVGRDKGEWGGGLWWFRLDDPAPVKVLEGNVSYLGISSFGPYAIVEVPTVTDESMTLAAMRRDDRGDWVVARHYEFKGQALSLLDRGDEGVYLLSRLALLRWNGEAMRSVLSGLEAIYDLDPHWLAVGDEDISVSMRMLRLTAAKDGTQPRWFVTPQCSTFQMTERTIVMAGLSGKVPYCVCTGTR